jgi:hypothetical protein
MKKVRGYDRREALKAQQLLHFYSLEKGLPFADKDGSGVLLKEG